MGGVVFFRSPGYDAAKDIENIPNAEPGEIISNEKFMRLRLFAIKLVHENATLKKEVIALMTTAGGQEVLDGCEELGDEG